MSKKVLIVGGVAGGAGTAARLRKMEETAEIIVFERGGIYTLRNMADVDRLKTLVTQRRPGRAVVIGGGAIGIEMAENLRFLGSDVIIVEAAAQILGPLDEDMTKLVGKTLLDKGIKIVLNDGVKSFTGQENIEVVLNSGRTVEADFVLLAIGVKPENKLARDAGLALGERGGVKVDDYL